MTMTTPNKISIGLIIVLVIGAVAAGYVAYHDVSQIRVKPAQQAQSSDTATTEQTDTQTTPPSSPWQWTSFSNKQLGVSFEYPSDWKVEQGDARVMISTEWNNAMYEISISRDQNPKSLSAKDWVDQSLTDNKKASASGEAPPTRYDGVKYYDVGGVSQAGYGIYGVFAYDSSDEIITVTSAQYAYTIRFPVAADNPNLVDPVKNHDVALHLLSTFKVLEQTAPAVKIYSDVDNHIEFSYPETASAARFADPDTNTIEIAREPDVHVRVAYYPSITKLTDAKSLDDYFSQHEAASQMVKRTAITFNGEKAWAYLENGLTTVYTILVPHADGSIHIISYERADDATKVTDAETAIIKSILFVK